MKRLNGCKKKQKLTKKMRLRASEQNNCSNNNGNETYAPTPWQSNSTYHMQFALLPENWLSEWR